MKLEIEELLPESEGFPVSKEVKVIRGLKITKTSDWLKAIVLVDVGKKLQLRLYGWQKDKEGKYKVRQKFNISKGYAGKLGRILLAFAMS